MFGDPVSNPYGYDKVTLSDLADIKIGPFGSLLHKEDYIDGGHPLLNPSHIVDGKVSPDDKLTISDEKYEELSAYQLKTGDVVMGRRGEMGRCAVVPEDGFLCGTGSMFIRTKGEVTADYIQNFCIGLSSIIDIVLPEAVGFGGSFSYYQDLFLDKIQNKFNTQKLLADDKSIPVFTFGDLKNDAGIIGATLF